MTSSLVAVWHSGCLQESRPIVLGSLNAYDILMHKYCPPLIKYLSLQFANVHSVVSLSPYLHLCTSSTRSSSIPHNHCSFPYAYIGRYVHVDSHTYTSRTHYFQHTRCSMSNVLSESYFLDLCNWEIFL